MSELVILYFSSDITNCMKLPNDHYHQLIIHKKVLKSSILVLMGDLMKDSKFLYTKRF